MDTPKRADATRRARSKTPDTPKPTMMTAAPPLTPSRSGSGERTAEINTTAYFTADEEEEIENKMEQLNGEMSKIKISNDEEFKGSDNEEKVMEKKYSQQLDLALKTVKLEKYYLKIARYVFFKKARDVDEKVRQEFCGQEFGYTAFCYLIMDPRILGNDVDAITFRTFVDSIFYVGKGSKNRPLQHFIDARNERRKNLKPTEMKENSKKINEIWDEGLAIPRHEIAHGISNEEAFVREGSIIEALRVKNLSNQKAGHFQGSTKKWDNETKAEYGTFLLHQALTTLKTEGIRTIREDSLSPFVNNRRGGGTPKTPN